MKKHFTTAFFSLCLVSIVTQAAQAQLPAPSGSFRPATVMPAKSGPAAKPSAANVTTATAADPTEARVATDKLVTKYTLDADQAKQMYTIQTRKLRNLAEIEPLRTGNLVSYREKLENLQQGNLVSIRRILHTKEQVELFEKTKVALRNQRAEARKALLLQGASKDRIETAVLEIYAE